MSCLLVTQRSFTRLRFILIAILGIASVVTSSHAITLESAILGATGRRGGVSVSDDQFVGWRFEIDQPLQVSHVGGHLTGSLISSEIFAAIVSLDSIDSLPHGLPLTASEVVATTTFEPPFPSDAILTPLNVMLEPGAYALLYGSGLFGATGNGGVPNFSDQFSIPPTTLETFIFWNETTPGIFTWREGLSSQMRFVVEGMFIPEPITATLGLMGLGVLGIATRRRVA